MQHLSQSGTDLQRALKEGWDGSLRFSGSLCPHQSFPEDDKHLRGSPKPGRDQEVGGGVGGRWENPGLSAVLIQGRVSMTRSYTAFQLSAPTG